MSFDEINKNYYNFFGNSYNKIPFDSLPDLLQKYEIGHKLLEIGPGGGALAEWLKDHGCQVTCVEPAEVYVEKIKKRGIEVYCTTIQNYTSDQKYDSVIAISSLLHVPKAELPSQIQKIFNFLNPQGLFILSFIVGESEGIEDPEQIGINRFFAKWTEREMRELLSPYFVLQESHQEYVKKMKSTFILAVYAKK